MQSPKGQMHTAGADTELLQFSRESAYSPWLPGRLQGRRVMGDPGKRELLLFLCSSKLLRECLQGEGAEMRRKG